MARNYGALNGFPKHAKDINSWLDEIQLGPCKEAFAGLTLLDLMSLSNKELEEIVPVPGRRRRLILALHALKVDVDVVPQLESRMQSMSTQSTLKDARSEPAEQQKRMPKAPILPDLSDDSFHRDRDRQEDSCNSCSNTGSSRETSTPPMLAPSRTVSHKSSKGDDSFQKKIKVQSIQSAPL